MDLLITIAAASAYAVLVVCGVAIMWIVVEACKPNSNKGNDV